MSEPMTSVEIEDVLSSIRKLVSDDLRPKARPQPVPAAQPTAEVTPPTPSEGKLLLTPSLRVVAVPAPTVANPPRPAAPLPRLHLGIETRKDVPPEAAAPMVELGEADFEPETGDNFPAVARMEWTEDGWVLAAAAPSDPQPSADFPDPWAQEDLSEPTPEVEPVALAAHDDPAWADRAEAEAIAQLNEPRPDRVQEARPEAASPDGADPLEVVFDEQVLRELVREILREELQGRLGERITRNIRKLVHAEIARLVAAQELD